MSVAFDAVGPSANGVSANTSALGWSHTCTGSNLLLIVGVAIGANPDTSITTTAAYNSISMASAGLIHSNSSTAGYVQMFYLVAPSTGPNTVAVFTSATVDIITGSVSFTGVNQAQPLGTPVTAAGDNNTGTNPPTATVPSSAGNFVIDALCYGKDISNSTGTLQWLNNFNTNSAGGNGAQSIYNGAASVKVGYNPAALDWWGLIAVSVQATPSATAWIRA